MKDTGFLLINGYFLFGMSLLFALGLSVLVIALYTGYRLTHPTRQIVGETPEQHVLTYEDITFPSKPAPIRLKGWWLPAQQNRKRTPSENTVIFAHGYGACRLFLPGYALLLAKALCNSGFNVLMFDFRNSGESSAAVTSVGYYEKDDLLAAIDYVVSRKQSSRVSLMGWSMGAATSLIAAPEAAAVVAVVADSPFATLSGYLRSNLSIWSGLPNFPFTPLILWLLSVIHRIDLSSVNPMQAAKSLGSRRLLLIHAISDPAISYLNSKQIYTVVKDRLQAQLWLTDGGGHPESYVLHQEEYEKRVIEFLTQSMVKP
ncbi:alpha/beta hydrolase [Acetonema longum]|uniref:AB hydrolase-1 domain-containing protein n=1 Tax=Acetonema longum DSM 6540 TaxID=1009370 RepID=F7NHS8_9FIRM|nr:alpha/beta fold hydrolase [Acetonema longum]EGO64453.1 hypothetical protein ALO_08128 [Acetonema longum DSM 6540]